MSWLRRRAIRKFIADPDKYLVVNPRFCDHIYINGICKLCNINKDMVEYSITMRTAENMIRLIIDNYFFTWGEAFKAKKVNEEIWYNKKLGMYYLKNPEVIV